MHDASHCPAPQTLRADACGSIRAACRRDADSLQIRLKLAACDPSDLGTDTAEVLGPTARLDRVADLGAFAADFANPSHGVPLNSITEASTVGRRVQYSETRSVRNGTRSGSGERTRGVAGNPQADSAHKRVTASTSSRTRRLVPIPSP